MVKSEVFDKNALEYDMWFDHHKREYAQELKAIREFLPKGGKGVEIGAGTGRFAQALGISLGIEPSKAMRSIASGRGVNIIAGTAESLPIKDGVYDFALLVTTVCFLDAPELAFREVYRILKAGGAIIVGLIDKNSITGKKYQGNKDESRFYKDARFYSPGEVRKELEKAGFTDFDYRQAILPGDTDEDLEPEVKQGHGEGSFVVLRAQKHVDE
ncbi:MAG: class I SAM-dependent methyltransferase [Gammaproteobacteria bacterium]|nr:MAG: class I SAM-dependent methyltransferase [Gammaproteobacteria bacterium]